MDTSKYNPPKLPSIENILEDISDPNVVKITEKFKDSNDEDILHDAYKCYLNIKKLKEDSNIQNELDTKLEDLDKELVHNIQKMKNQK